MFFYLCFSTYVSSIYTYIFLRPKNVNNIKINNTINIIFSYNPHILSNVYKNELQKPKTPTNMNNNICDINIFLYIELNIIITANNVTKLINKITFIL